MARPEFGDAVLQACLGTFAEEIEYRAQGHAPDPARGIFRADHVGVVGPDPAEVSSVSPRLGVQLSEFPYGCRADDELVLTRTGVVYRVEDVEPDGEGGAELVLQKIPT